MASDERQNRVHHEIAALRMVLGSLELTLERVEAWRALRQLDERESSGQPLQSVDGVLFRGRLLRQLESESRAWRAYRRIEEAIEQLLGGEAAPVVAEEGTVARTGSSAGDNLPELHPAPRLRVKVRAGRAIVGCDGDAGQSAVPAAAETSERSETASRSVLERIRTLKPVAEAEQRDSAWPSASSLAAAVWGDRSIPAPEIGAPAVDSVGTGSSRQRPFEGNEKGAGSIAARAGATTDPSRPGPDAVSSAPGIPRTEPPDDASGDRLDGDVTARVLDLESRLARLMEREAATAASGIVARERDPVVPAEPAGALRDRKDAELQPLMSPALVVANDLTPFGQDEDFDEEAEVEIVVLPRAVEPVSSPVAQAGDASTPAIPAASSGARRPTDEDPDGLVSLHWVEEASVEIVSGPMDPTAPSRESARKPSAG